jgi:MOSC domain-containing protein YiiM
MPDAQTQSLAVTGAVNGVFAGPVRSLRSPRQPGAATTAWRSGILKSPVAGAAMVRELGIDGDMQKERRFHGGPFKAILIYSADHYDEWRQVMEPHAAACADALRAMSAVFDASVFGFGAFGENLTIAGMDEHSVCIGDLWRVGNAVLRITEPRGPCNTLTRRWMRPALLPEITTNARAGWYNVVHTPGDVRTGDSAELIERVQHEWTVARVFHLLYQRVVSRAEVQTLHDAPFTNPGLLPHLAKRLLTPGRTRE